MKAGFDEMDRLISKGELSRSAIFTVVYDTEWASSTYYDHRRAFKTLSAQEPEKFKRLVDAGRTADGLWSPWFKAYRKKKVV